MEEKKGRANSHQLGKEKMMTKWDLKIEGVFEKELYSLPTLMSVVVAKIIGSRREIPKAFKVANELPDLGDMRHLRRIRDGPDDSTEFILCRARPIQEVEKNKELLEKLAEKFKAEEIFCDYQIVQVPESAPQTELQLKACADVWPCKYAKNNYLINCLAGSIFSDLEKLTLKVIVNKTLEILESDTNILTSAGVVFRCNKAYGVGLSNFQGLNANQTFHATMLAIDHVATMAGAGQWKSPAGDKFLSKIQEQLDQEEDLKEHKFESNSQPYLCTNYDVFVTEEPCLMCIMGLVQSRIRRLYYLDAESLKRLRKCKKICYQDSAIEHFRIHRSRHLNHRFEAWKISLVRSEEPVAVSSCKDEEGQDLDKDNDKDEKQ